MTFAIPPVVMTDMEWLLFWGLGTIVSLMVLDLLAAGVLAAFGGRR